MKVQSIQPTPNPNAFKFLVDRQLAQPGQNLSYSKPEDARHGEQALGEHDWRGVAEQVTQLLESHVGTEEPRAAPADAGTAGDDPLAAMPKGGDPEMLSRINALLDDRVRPALAGDGGGLQVMGLDGKTLVIRYQGACGSCPSSTAGTMMAIQNLLQTEIDDELVVTMG